MSKSIPDPSPELNRLRAAAGLIPIIESGLSDSKLSKDRAIKMTKFCTWVLEVEPKNDEEARLSEIVISGLGRLMVQLDITAV